NVGIKAAKGEYIAFTDADCVVDRNCLKELVKGFDSEDIAACGGKVLAKEITTYVQNFIEEQEHLAQQQTHNDDTERFIYTIVTANAIFKKQIFQEVGYFDEALITCEDSEMGYRLFFIGYQIKYMPKSIVYHRHIKSLKKFCVWCFSFGFNKYTLFKKYKEIFNFDFDSPYIFRKIFTPFFLLKNCIRNLLSSKHRFDLFVLGLVGNICFIMGGNCAWLKDITSGKRVEPQDAKNPLLFPDIRKKVSISYNGLSWQISKYIFSYPLEKYVEVFDISRQQYFMLEGSADFIWKSLLRSQDSSSIITELAETYDIPKEEIERDFVGFLKQLEDDKIIFRL
ncbi:MAG: PqqD family peptide modification chaperone, partial [Candidatus Omnitrophota bacterium]